MYMFGKIHAARVASSLDLVHLIFDVISVTLISADPVVLLCSIFSYTVQYLLCDFLQIWSETCTYLPLMTP